MLPTLAFKATLSLRTQFCSFCTCIVTSHILKRQWHCLLDKNFLPCRCLWLGKLLKGCLPPIVSFTSVRQVYQLILLLNLLFYSPTDRKNSQHVFYEAKGDRERAAACGKPKSRPLYQVPSTFLPHFN